MIKLGFDEVVVRPKGVICVMPANKDVQIIEIIIAGDKLVVRTEKHYLDREGDYDDIIWKVCSMDDLVKEVQNLIWYAE